MQNIFNSGKKWFIAALIFNLAAICLYGFLFWSVKEKNERVSQAANDIELKEKQVENAGALRLLAEDTALLREKVDSYIVGKDEAVSFIEMLESLGMERGVDVSVESVEAADAVGDFPAQELRLALRAEGSWRNILSFLGLVELLPYETRVSRVSLSRGAETEVGAWNGSITVSVLKAK